MTEPSFTWVHHLAHSLPVRIFLVVLTTALVAGVCPFIFYINRSISPALLRLVAVVLVGLSAGFTAAAILSSNPAPIKFITAWVSMILGLAALHLLTNSYVGIELLPSSLINMDSTTIAQLISGTLAAGLATLAWKPIPHRQAVPFHAQPQPTTKISKPKPQQKRQPVHSTGNLGQVSKVPRQVTKHLGIKKFGRQWEKQLKALKTRTNASLSRSNAKVASWLTNLSARAATAAQRRRPTIHMRTTKPHRNPRLRKKHSVRLVGKAENRCPYCLEIIQPDDPRGIKICPECNTYHHADCWAITGNCQVPHYHE